MARDITKEATNYSYDIEVVELIKSEAIRETEEFGFKVKNSPMANKLMREALKARGLL